MPISAKPPVSRPFDKNMVRNWTLYVVRANTKDYYVGITSRRDFMKRISEHGTLEGARWLRGKTVQEIIEIQHLGRMTAQQAQNIENSVTLTYRRKYGASRVRGGYDIMLKRSVVPNYTPGSLQSIMFIVASIILAIGLLVFISRRG